MDNRLRLVQNDDFAKQGVKIYALTNPLHDGCFILQGYLTKEDQLRIAENALSNYPLYPNTTNMTLSNEVCRTI